jgi:hypothetical protein
MRLLPLIPVATLASAVLAQTPAQGAGFGAHWALDEVGSPPPAAVDSVNGNNGTNTAVVGDGQGYSFNGVDSKVVVGDSPSLSPGLTDFGYGVTLTTGLPTAGSDYDVMRKGLSSTVGGEYKVEILNVNGLAKAMCLVKDADKHVASIRWAPKGGLADGKQHTISCQKTSTGVTLQVDSYAPRTKTNLNGIGSVANDGSLFLGTKSSTGGDPFSGEIFDAHVS